MKAERSEFLYHSWNIHQNWNASIFLWKYIMNKKQRVIIYVWFLSLDNEVCAKIRLREQRRDFFTLFSHPPSYEVVTGAPFSRSNFLKRWAQYSPTKGLFGGSGTALEIEKKKNSPTTNQNKDRNKFLLISIASCLDRQRETGFDYLTL